jgi:hypothetical protein
MIFGKINEIMKKMQFFMVLLLTAMTVFFTSCPDPNSGPNNSTPDNVLTNEELILGKWECTRMDYDSEYQGEKESGSDYFKKGESVWEFDGEDIVMYTDGKYDAEFRYEIEGDKLYTEYATFYMAKYLEITTLNDTKLVLDVSYEYQGAKAKCSFVFKRM